MSEFVWRFDDSKRNKNRIPAEIAGRPAQFSIESQRSPGGIGRLGHLIGMPCAGVLAMVNANGIGDQSRKETHDACINSEDWRGNSNRQ